MQAPLHKLAVITVRWLALFVDYPSYKWGNAEKQQKHCELALKYLLGSQASSEVVGGHCQVGGGGGGDEQIFKNK